MQPSSIDNLDRLFGDQNVKVLFCDPNNVNPDEMLAEEREYIGHTSLKRLSHFASGRILSRELLIEFGYPNYPLLADQDRVPIWPEGIIGSISHCDTGCVVAVSRSVSAGLIQLGIDIEPDRPLKPDLWPFILNPEELEIVRSKDRQKGNLVRRYFGAKEAVYKAIFPLTRKIIEFHDVSIHFNTDYRSFEAEISESVTRNITSSFILVGNSIIYRNNIINSCETRTRSTLDLQSLYNSSKSYECSPRSEI